MKLIDVARDFNTDDKCLDYLERMRWPMGVCCAQCGSLKISRITRESKTKNKRTRLYQCLEKGCGHQFSPTAGTIFHDSHLPLTKWFIAIALICEAKKGVSACQIQRHLGVNYRTAWHLCHRIRQATKETGLLEGVVEVDETYMLPKRRRKGHPQPKRREPDVVLGMIERGGKLRFVALHDAKMASIEPEVLKHVSPDATLQTDMGVVYDIIGRRNFSGQHRMIDHTKSYGIGENHTNTIENAFSLLKRGVYGTFHKVSIKHLPRYCNEFSYRFNRRDRQPELFAETTKNLLHGEKLTYKKLTASQVSES